MIVHLELKVVEFRQSLSKQITRLNTVFIIFRKVVTIITIN